MTRIALPWRRPHEVFSFEHWGQRFHAGIGRAAESGPIREVWLNTGKSGTQAETLARDSAVLLSIALQYDIPLKAMQKAITRNLDGSASGPIGQLIDRLENERDQDPSSLPHDAGPTPDPKPSNAGALAHAD